MPTKSPHKTRDDLLILVDAEDQVVGHEAKERCHDGAGLLHRAFSVFLWNGRHELLLQQRSDEKRLWPGFWSNSVCSHPRKGEAIEAAAERRVREELGIHASLRFVYKFTYHATYKDVGSEREVCSVFVGQSDAPVRAEPREVKAWRYASASTLSYEIATRPDWFTPWFKMEWERLSRDFSAEIARKPV
ncbi:MAG: isopentenyl-diphosphate Delta-isomerase [Deltaproteobacteria bacterium]|nr:isopentenyl-diphosphate Delta-isomerase [Deltaproteobacteria bacterium]